MKNLLFIFLLVLGWSNSSAQLINFYIQDSLSADELATIIKGTGIEEIFNVRIGRGSENHFGSFNTYGIDNDFNMNAGIIMCNRPITNDTVPVYLYPLEYFGDYVYANLGKPHPLNHDYWGDTLYVVDGPSNAYYMLSLPEDGPHDIPKIDSALLYYQFDSIFNDPVLYYPTACWSSGTIDVSSASYMRSEIQFNFIPTGDTIRFKYVLYGSNSWTDGCNTARYNLFTAFLSGPGLDTPYNIARIPGTQTVVSSNTIAPLAYDAGMDTTPAADPEYFYYKFCRYLDTLAPYSEYYINNDVLQSMHVPYSGYTTPLEVVYPVNPCDTYHIKISVLPSGYFGGSYEGMAIEANSFRSNGPQSCATTDTTTSIMPESVREDFCLAYPNPFSESIQISLKGNTPIADEYQVNIIDINGRVVFEQKGSLRAINRSLLRIGKELSQGMYLLSIEDTKDYRRQLIKILKEE